MTDIRRKTLIARRPAISVCVATLVAGALVANARPAAAAGTPEQQCQSGRYAAAAKYAACQEKAVGKFFANSTNPGANAAFGAAAGKCLNKYAAIWPKLQAKAAATGSTCDAARFVDNGTTVTDNLTGLQWEKKTDDLTVHDKDNTYSWSTIFTDADGTVYTSFLSTLNGGCFAGQCDWRLPTFYELQTILSEPFQCFTPPCIDPIFGPMPPTLAETYWSGTNDAHQLGGAAWYVYFGDGLLGVGLKTDALAARAVRGGV